MAKEKHAKLPIGSFRIDLGYKKSRVKIKIDTAPLLFY